MTITSTEPTVAALRQVLSAGIAGGMRFGGVLANHPLDDLTSLISQAAAQLRGAR